MYIVYLFTCLLYLPVYWPFRNPNPRITHPKVEQPPAFELHKALDKDHVGDLAGVFECGGGDEEGSLGAGEEAGGVGEIEEGLSGGIVHLGVGAVVEEQDALGG